MDALRRAIETLYEVFGCYGLKSKMDLCPDCELDAAEASLRTRPLQTLTWKDFGVYPFKAMTTFGDESDFKHFLPRLFELYALDREGARYGVATVFEKLDYAAWTSWPEPEAAAIRDAVRAWLQSLTARQSDFGDEPWELEELRSALVESGLDPDSAA